MYLDDLPDIAAARLMRSRASGRAIREAGRAAAVAFTGDGIVAPKNQIVRFDVAQTERPEQRLGEAMVTTKAASLFYFGGDAVTRAAASEIGLESLPAIGVMIRRVDASIDHNGIELRAADLDAETRDMVTRHARGYLAPRIAGAYFGKDVVGYALIEELDGQWSDLSVFIYPTYRKRGYGAATIARAADAAERGGRMVCASFAVGDEPARRGLERAGFRLVDYYFVARRPDEASTLLSRGDTR